MESATGDLNLKSASVGRTTGQVLKDITNKMGRGNNCMEKEMAKSGSEPNMGSQATSTQQDDPTEIVMTDMNILGQESKQDGPTFGKPPEGPDIQPGVNSQNPMTPQHLATHAHGEYQGGTEAGWNGVGWEIG